MGRKAQVTRLRKGVATKGGVEKNNLGNRGHTIHWYLQGTTRTMSRAMVWGVGAAGREEVTARKGGRGVGHGYSDGRVGVKRNIFQQISHVCLIMYITACGAENQSTTAAIATDTRIHPSIPQPQPPSAWLPPLEASPSKRLEGAGGCRGWRREPVRRCILF